MKPMDKYYCPICGNMLTDNATVCLHCAAPIENPKPESAKAGGCLSALVLAAVLILAIALNAH